MNPLSLINLARLVLLQPKEYKWINDILKISRSNPQVKKEIMEFHRGNFFKLRILNHPRIIKGSHDNKSLRWSIRVAKLIMTNKHQIYKHRLGYKYK